MKEKNIIEEHLTYLEQVRNFTHNTMRKHRQICFQWEKFLTAERSNQLTEATPEDLLAWVEYRQVEVGVQDATIVRDLCVLRTLYAYLHHFGSMPVNPAASLPEFVCRPPAEQEYLTVDECFKLLETFDTDDPVGYRDYLVAVIMWCTGLRTGELCGLDWGDIDLEEGTLLVREGKGRKQRQLFLNDRLHNDLRSYRLKFGSDGEAPVFRSFTVNAPAAQKHARLSKSRVVDIIREHACSAGLAKSVSPLTLRHTFATHMYEAGVSIDDLKEMMGHTDNSETTIYVHVTIDAAKRLLNDHVCNPSKYIGGNIS